MSDVLDRTDEHEYQEPPPEAGSQLVTLNAPPPKRKNLTRAEEELLATRFAMCEKGQRYLILEAFERNAHKAAGKATFEEYCQERLGLKHDASYLSKMVQAAKVERAIQGESFDMAQLLLEGEVGTAKAAAKIAPKLTMRAAAEIGRLQQSDWAAIYTEHSALKYDKTPTPAERNSDLKKIVDRRYKELYPTEKAPKNKVGTGAKAGLASAGTPATEGGERVKPDMTPVTGQTYDGSPEQVFIEAGGTAEQWAAQNRPASAPGATESGSEDGSALSDMRKEIAILRSFVAAFVSMIDEGADVQKMNELYNDCTQYQQVYGC